MRKCKAENIGVLIRQFLREEGLEVPYNQYKLKNALCDILGEGMSRYITNSFIQNQTLIVQLSSPLLKQELNMQRQQLVTKLNQSVGAQVITDIKFV